VPLFAEDRKNARSPAAAEVRIRARAKTATFYSRRTAPQYSCSGNAANSTNLQISALKPIRSERTNDKWI
jgi:hypothetical protein